MVEATMLGVAKTLLQSGEHPRAYMERVTSPGGTTAAGLYELEPLLVEGAYAAVDGALERTAELANG
jgi:pyrroline-5-carboxylate reductase